MPIRVIIGLHFVRRLSHLIKVSRCRIGKGSLTLKIIIGKRENCFVPSKVLTLTILLGSPAMMTTGPIYSFSTTSPQSWP